MITRETPEQRVLLKNVGWETYGRLRKEREERRSPRFFYDRGVLEIVSPSTEHEAVSGVIASLVKELAVALEVDVFDAGSTTFVRQDLSGGFEPDGSFYFARRAGSIRGKKRIDLDAGDPPPDLIVEVDLTSPSLAKLPVYARMGVREVWRYAYGAGSGAGGEAGGSGESTGGGRLEVLGLEESGEGYELLPQSTVLGTGSKVLTAEMLGRFVEEGSEASYPEWVRRVRRWAE